MSNFKVTNILDSLSDKYLGTNNKQLKNMYNQNIFNQQQIQNALNATAYQNENKYFQNLNGMVKAGINPLAATGSLGSNATVNYQSQNTIDNKETKNGVSDLLKTILSLAVMFI